MPILLRLNLQHFAEPEGGQAGGTNAVTPEATKTPEPQATEPKADPMIPKARFDEINSKYKEMADKVAEFEKLQAQAKADAEAKELEAKKEQGKFEELYLNSQKELDSYKQYQERAKQLETVMSSMVETKLKNVPEEMHDLVPTNLSAEDTLEWITKAESKGLFAKQEAKEIGKPSNQSKDTPKVDKSNMSALDKIIAGLGK